MGPIERELRERAEAGQFGKKRLGHEAYMLMVDAMCSLYDQWYSGPVRPPFPAVSTHQHWADIMSEAIEQAEALKL